jgi:hypothetical protein
VAQVPNRRTPRSALGLQAYRTRKPVVGSLGLDSVLLTEGRKFLGLGVNSLIIMGGGGGLLPIIESRGDNYRLSTQLQNGEWRTLRNKALQNLYSS